MPEKGNPDLLTENEIHWEETSEYMWLRCIRASALINHGGAESLQWQGGERSRELSSFSLEMPLSKPEQLKNEINCRERLSLRSDLMEAWIAIGGKPIARNWLKGQIGVDQEHWLLVIGRQRGKDPEFRTWISGCCCRRRQRTRSAMPIKLLPENKINDAIL